MQEDLLAVQEQVVEEELAEHQLQSLLPPVLAGLLPLSLWGLGCAREYSLIKLSRVADNFLPGHWIPKHPALVVRGIA